MRNFISRISREQKTRILLLAALFISSLIIYRGYIFGNGLMVYNDVGGDTWQQYTMHYATIVNHLREGNFSLWDFTNGFGTSMFNLNLFDPSLMVLYGLGVLFGPAYMLFFLVWMQIGRILLAGWVFYWFLSEFSFGRQGKFLAAYAYGLSGYLLVWGQHYQFGMVTVYFPLMLLLCEKFIKGKKGKALFPVTVFVCGIYSVYFTYMCLIGVGFYLLFRVLTEERPGKERAKKFFVGCGQMLLGVGMSLAVFLPTAAVLLNVSSRLEKKRSLQELLLMCFTPTKPEYYESLLLRPFSTNLQNLQELGDKTYEGFWNYYEAPVLFCSVLTVFLFVQFLLCFWKSQAALRVKRVVYGAAVFAALAVLLPVGGFAFNAFTGQTYRYTFVLLPFLLIAAVWMWDYMKKGGKTSLAGAVLVEILLIRAGMLGYREGVFAEYRRNALALIAAGTVMFLCLLALNRIRENRGKYIPGRQAVLAVLLIAAVCNVLMEGSTNYEGRVTLKKEDTPAEEMAAQMERYTAAVSGEPSEEQARAALERPQDYFRELYSQDIQDALAYLEETDKTFYRVEKDFSSATISMDSLAQGYRGISTYNSVMNGNVKEFVDVCWPGLYYADKNRYTFWDNAKNNRMASFAGIRYLLSRDGSLSPKRYRLVKQFGSIYLYENTLESDVARFYDRTVSEEALVQADKKQKKKLLSNVLALEGEETPADGVPSGPSEAVKNSKVILDAPEKDSHITGQIEAASDGYVLFMIPYEQGWSLAIDGKETPLIRGDLGFLACKVSSGSHTLTLTYHAPMLKEGLLLSAVCWVGYVVWVFWGRKRWYRFVKISSERGAFADTKE